MSNYFHEARYLNCTGL